MSVTKVSSAMQDLTDDYAFSGTVSGAGNPGRGIIGGLRITNDGTDAAHDIGIAVGFARDYTDAATMSLTGALIKKIDATWAVGTNAGGLDSTDTVGATTGYGVYLIRRSDTGVVDVLMSSDMTAAGSALTMPTNYDQKRLIGWVLTDGSSNILSFTQSGDYFRLTGAIPTFVNDSSITATTFENATLPMPPLCIAELYGRMENASHSGSREWLTLMTKGAGEDATDVQEVWMTVETAGTSDAFGRSGTVLLASDSGVAYTTREDSGSATVILKGLACNMLTRSNP
jgi:hypothetical protein